MGEKNAKEELLKFTKIHELTILSIDCGNGDEFMARHLKEKGDECQKLLEYYKSNAKRYTSLDDLDFEYDPCLSRELEGVVYCFENDTKAPVWLTRGNDEAYSWWNLNKVPKYFVDIGAVNITKMCANVR